MSWEKKCEGIQNFITDFTKTYLEPGIELKFDPSHCSHYWSSTQLDYHPKVTLKIGENSLTLEVRITAKFDWATHQMDVDRASLWRFEEENSSVNYTYRSEDGVFGRKLLLLESTVNAWAKEKTDGEALVFGIPYQQFTRDFEERYGPSSSGIKTSAFNSVTIQLFPEQNSTGSGRVNFVEVDPDIFLSHNGKPKKYLGCENLECLNSAPIRYELLGDLLVLIAPSIKGEDCRIETMIHYFTLQQVGTNGDFKLSKEVFGSIFSPAASPCEGTISLLGY
ncbi:hypothetical protein [Oligoflexus tunisiensis]|uniref:hypothetical protein n=1 Tax=Oligoflexus tunisiensis TaxID=708132 RepID=UPI00114CC097|nr:hypothetical protein [Oligoflexus tunisiensis]